MKQSWEDGVTLASESLCWKSARYCTYGVLGKMNTFLKLIESRRHFIKGETCPAVNIFISITNFTRRSAKSPRYWSIIGRFHMLSGAPCRRTKPQKSKAE